LPAKVKRQRESLACAPGEARGCAAHAAMDAYVSGAP